MSTKGREALSTGVGLSWLGQESGGIHEGLLEEETPVWILQRPFLLLLEHKGMEESLQ